MALAGLPTLEEVSANPRVVEHLPRPALHALCLRALAVHQVCTMAMIAGAPDEAPASAGGGPLLTAGEVSAMMGGVSKRQIYRQAKQYPWSTFVVRPTPGLVRFRRALVEEYLRDPDAYRVRHAGASAPGPASPVRPLGRRGARA